MAGNQKSLKGLIIKVPLSKKSVFKKSPLSQTIAKVEYYDDSLKTIPQAAISRSGESTTGFRKVGEKVIKELTGKEITPTTSRQGKPMTTAAISRSGESTSSILKKKKLIEGGGGHSSVKFQKRDRTIGDI